MREINVAEITENISDMCIEINHRLSDDMEKALYDALEKEESSTGRQVLSQLKKNLETIAWWHYWGY